MKTPRKFTTYFDRFLTTTDRTTLQEIFLDKPCALPAILASEASSSCLALLGIKR